MGGDDIKGVIQNVARKQQINDFSGLQFGNITPTDIDGIIEYKNTSYIIIEVKYMDTPLPYGQKLFIGRFIVDVPKPAICIVATHSEHDTNNHVNVGDCLVREVFIKNELRWREPVAPLTVRELCNRFIDRVNSGKI